MFHFYTSHSDIEFSAKKTEKGTWVTYKNIFGHYIPDCDILTVRDKVESIINSQLKLYTPMVIKPSYLMYADGRFKIGTSQNPQKRLKEIQTGSPNVSLYGVTQKFTEKILHSLFKTHKVKGEWFDLRQFDARLLKWIFDDSQNEDFKYVVMLHLACQTPNISEYSAEKIHEKYLSFLIPFGKHKNVPISRFETADSVGYLEMIKLKINTPLNQSTYLFFINYHLNLLKSENRYPEFK